MERLGAANWIVSLEAGVLTEERAGAIVTLLSKMGNDTLAQLLRREATRYRLSWKADLATAEAASPGHVSVQGRDLIALCVNDYLGLACDSRVIEAARSASSLYGAGTRASRSLGGDTAVHRELELELADFKQAEAALLFGSGLTCNISTINALARTGDLVCSDALNHASIVDGCRLSDADVAIYRHSDIAHLAEVLETARQYRMKLIITDAVFSMEGEIARIPEIVTLAERHGASIMLDEAHATGVLGPSGQGTLSHFDLHGRVEVLMGTLGKALGSVGGYIAGSNDLIDYLARSARGFLFTTSLPASAAGAALAALRILRAEPERVRLLWANTERLHSGLKELGFTVFAEPRPIMPVLFGDDDSAIAMAVLLRERGILVRAVGPPYVPPGTSRLRVSVSAAYEREEIDHVIEAFADARAALSQSRSTGAVSL
jgi:8-amino-7-oxononanoate synthase